MNHRQVWPSKICTEPGCSRVQDTGLKAGLCIDHYVASRHGNSYFCECDEPVTHECYDSLGARLSRSSQCERCHKPIESMLGSTTRLPLAQLLAEGMINA